MATRFEIVLHGEHPTRLRAAGEEALDEIDRLEDQLSLFRAGSEIAQLNARAAREAVRVTPELFALLQKAQALCAETDGAFDITVAPLVRCWGFLDGKGTVPQPETIAAARELVGLDKLHLDVANHTVRFARDGVMLDLGAIGKGYAVERAANLLREAGITSALIHGGTSTITAIGHPPDADDWKIALAVPVGLKQRSDREPFVVSLRDESLSASTPSERRFEFAGKTYGHVIDPRTGYPSEAALLAAVVLPSATETDAFSTALLALGSVGLERISNRRPNARMLLLTADGEASGITTLGW